MKFKFNIGVGSIPHYSKKEKGGEDASATHEGMIAVADGVGGWNESGIDPSKYSRELCVNIKKEFLKNGHKFFATPKRLFVEAAYNTTAIGSATFCMCVLDQEKNYLHSVNLGDSGYMLLRNNKLKKQHTNEALDKILDQNENTANKDDILDIVYRSEEQQHSFNFPYQVGTHGDRPEVSITNVHEIQENDIIVLATDGLWDNLYDEQITAIIRPFAQLSETIQDLDIVADMISETCLQYSMNTKYKSPFSKRSGGLYLGGKEDDITVVVAQIVKNI